MNIGNKIKQLRYRSSVTQEQLAERLGISAQAVSKWENGVTMPDISLLPALAETFGITIDDLFDLTTEQKFNRIENRLDTEKELPRDVLYDYEEFLKGELAAEENKARATELLAYLYWHSMNSASEKVRRYAKDAIRNDPGKKGCQWMLSQAERHAVWDWNVSNHSKAIDFYREVAGANPDKALPLEFLIDNLIADHRTDEAEKYLDKLCSIEEGNPVLKDIYRAHIALARFDESAADAIINELGKKYPEDASYLFEAAQYYAKKCDYGKAVKCYELSFEKEVHRPRYIDALQGIAQINEIKEDYAQAARTYDRIVDVMRNEWGLTEEVELTDAEDERARLLAKA